MRPRVWLSGAFAVLALGLVAGCTSSNPASSNPASGTAGAVAPGRVAVGSAASGSGSSAAGSSATAPNAPLAGISAAGRQVVRTATVALTVTNVTNTVNRVQQIADTAGGYVGNEDAQDQQASITLQVPEPQLDMVIGQLSGLGRVTSRQQLAQDVTNQLVDARSRIASQQASVDRVRALMGQATSLSDVVSVESELTRRESDLEALEQQQAELAGQVAMSTLTVNLVAAVPPPKAVAAAPSPGFGSGLAGGWHALLATFRVLGVVFGALLPFLVVLGVLALGGLLAWRRWRRAPAS